MRGLARGWCAAHRAVCKQERERDLTVPHARERERERTWPKGRGDEARVVSVFSVKGGVVSWGMGANRASSAYAWRLQCQPLINTERKRERERESERERERDRERDRERERKLWSMSSAVLFSGGV